MKLPILARSPTDCRSRQSQPAATCGSILPDPRGSRRQEAHAHLGEASQSLLTSAATVHRSLAAFTLVEIAISLAVIGFALVAIVGVLPIGLNSQKESRQETIIDHDANYFLTLIRNGERGADDLTNYVVAITNFWTRFELTPTRTNVTAEGFDGYTQTRSRIRSFNYPEDEYPLTNGLRIVGLVGRPKYQFFSASVMQSNHIMTYVRSLSGAATEKSPQTNATVRDLAFSYRFLTEITPVQVPPTNDVYRNALQANLREVRLLFRWPLQPGNRTGNGRELYRAQVGGRLLQLNDAGHPLFFLEPTTYVQAQ